MIWVFNQFLSCRLVSCKKFWKGFHFISFVSKATVEVLHNHNHLQFMFCTNCTIIYFGWHNILGFPFTFFRQYYWHHFIELVRNHCTQYDNNSTISYLPSHTLGKSFKFVYRKVWSISLILRPFCNRFYSNHLVK